MSEENSLDDILHKDVMAELQRRGWSTKVGDIEICERQEKVLYSRFYFKKGVLETKEKFDNEYDEILRSLKGA